MKIAIIGAGPAGLTAAYKLSLSNHKVDLYESTNMVGGMAKTIPLWGQLVDLGPHRFFSNDPRVNKLWLELAEKDYTMVNRLTRIYYKGKFFDYPLKPFNALKNLGLIESIYCVFSYLIEKFFFTKSRDLSTFEGWVISRFGHRLFEIFFKSYSEKLWGIPCKDLDSDFAAQRIKKLSLYEAIKNSFFNKKTFKHKTLVDQFAYPNEGAGAIYEKMSKKIIKNGANIFFNTKILSIDDTSKNNKIYIKFNDSVKSYDHIISTMPITNLIQSMSSSSKEVISYSKKLKFRNTILVYLRIETEELLFPDQWIYVHASNLKTGRITNFKNWVKTINQNSKDTIICLEYWCNSDDNFWLLNNDDYIKLAEKEIVKTDLVSSKNIKDGHVVRIPRCYPIYSKGYKDTLKPIQQFLTKNKMISVIGRYGAFKYNNQDHSILMGILAAENIINNTDHNLWELNTDYEYQESSKITETGLEKLD